MKYRELPPKKRSQNNVRKLGNESESEQFRGEGYTEDSVAQSHTKSDNGDKINSEYLGVIAEEDSMMNGCGAETEKPISHRKKIIKASPKNFGSIYENDLSPEMKETVKAASNHL